MNRQAFDKLCQLFGEVYQETVESDPKPRKRARGGGRKARLQSMEAKLFFILFYSQRVVCENAHAGIKRYNSASGDADICWVVELLLRSCLTEIGKGTAVCTRFQNFLYSNRSIILTFPHSLKVLLTTPDFFVTKH
jgi:hypothetical protein